jgi:uncharacterized phage infection (PIP) family protein YhgE
METFQIDYDKLDVEAIMARIRQRVREKKEVLYTEQDLKKLGGLQLPDPLPPKRKDPDRHKVPVPEVPKIDLKHRITERTKELQLDDIKDTDFVTEAMKCVGEWNVNITLEDLYKSHPNWKGKIIQGIRAVNRRLFKLVMNIDVLFPQFHRQAVINQTNVVVLHALVQEISQLSNELHRLSNHLTGRLDEINTGLTNAVSELDADLKKTRAEILRDQANDKNDFQRSINQVRDDIEQLEYKIGSLRGLIEGQRLQLEYVQARQRALEQMAVLKDEKPEEPKAKTTNIPKGRYRPRKTR